MLSKEDIEGLLRNLRCSNCLSDFNKNSFYVMRFDEGLFVLKISCKKCGKTFGIAFLGLDEEELLNSVKTNFEQQKTPISFDDVLNAHNYIQNLDENWRNFITDKSKKH